MPQSNPSPLGTSIPRDSIKIGTLIVVAMVTTSVAGHFGKPRLLMAEERNTGKIEQAIPLQFGDWKLAPTGAVVVNPQATELVNTLYSELLNRTYSNSKGQRVMLAIAYGRDQSDDLQVHEPTICYPSQGFKVTSSNYSRVDTIYGNVPIHRIETHYGTRFEPVIYWTTVGDKIVEPKFLDKKIKKFQYSLQGKVPDGLLFRVSSIDDNSDRAFKLQGSFTKDLLESLTPAWRLRLAGLAAGH